MGLDVMGVDVLGVDIMALIKIFIEWILIFMEIADCVKLKTVRINAHIFSPNHENLATHT